MQTLPLYLLVFVGGGIGSALRLAANRLSLMSVGVAFPAGTLFVNVVGCVCMGFVSSLFAFRGEWFSQSTRLFITTGILGGFTTFSAFSLDFFTLWQRGDVGVALTYLGASLLVSFAGLAGGLALARYLFG
ncbi:fluoride efflux transporter CrcB [Chitinasiproducens palmae]|uniref:Fluoride-specific ion channel FluC n=1 Tax=Chitinasiproducens palmae TaxID=1770053 RepID=A0A1H2PTL7_9BURK|nr:fluoride efflux transporter CrcB [Chitinasiproducens palmae]SDV50466.1 camphor resistance protein CrcB [Chitinasiproducens palmae]